MPAMQETWVQSLGLEDPLEKGMATHSSILAWRIPWTEESIGLQLMSRVVSQYRRCPVPKFIPFSFLPPTPPHSFPPSLLSFSPLPSSFLFLSLPPPSLLAFFPFFLSISSCQGPSAISNAEHGVVKYDRHFALMEHALQ